MVSLDDVIATAVDTSAIDADSKRISIVTGGARARGLRQPGAGHRRGRQPGRERRVVLRAGLDRAGLDHGPTRTRVEISVVDQGIGIPTGEIDRIFERFYRVDPARHRSTGGTGLGLSIVKHVAATHGGEVRVWSVEGQGSTFTLTLPRQEARRQADDPVLVVEDEESYSDALAYMLRKEGFEVAIAADRAGRAHRVRPQRRRHRAARPDAARHPRHRGLPPDPADLQRPGDHGERQGRRGRQGGRPRARRRRLRHQAVLPPRAGRPDPRRAAPRPPSPTSRRRPSRPARCGWTSSATS